MYTVETINAGILTKQDINVVKVPRSEFLGLVDDLLSKDRYKALTDELRPVAEQMERFPMGEWIHPTRGCGCVVGEYLVATGEVERAIAAEHEGSCGLSGPTVTELLAQRGDDGRTLEAFGEDIDQLVRYHVRSRLQSADERFDAVEIVD